MDSIFVSIDVGLHNLATVIEQNNKIIFTESKNLTSKQYIDNSVLISLTTAFVRTVRFPVFMAGITKQGEAEKSPYTLHERLH